MKSIARIAAVFGMALALSACVVAPQAPVPLSPTALNAQARVGVVMTTLPKVDLALPGASCLICYGVASAANSALNKHTQGLTHEDLPQLKDQLAQALNKKGAAATVIVEPLDLKSLPDAAAKGPNLALKDFSSLRKKYGVDKLLVIEVTALGMERTYASYVPTSPPRAYLAGAGYMVNLGNNTYEWFNPVRILRAADGNWDEPPTFPGLTNAYYQVLELGKDEFLKPFSE